MRFGYAFVWVDDVPAAVDFYEHGLGLRRLSLVDNGELGFYAELDTGETTLAIADTREARALFPAGFRPNAADEPPNAFQISFITADVEARYRDALAAGGTSVADPAEQPWGQVVARLRDPHGVLVSLVTPPPRRPE